MGSPAPRAQTAHSPPLMSAQRAVRTPRPARLLARLLGGLGVAMLLALFLPWQQASSASGGVVAWDPNDRQQTIDAPVEGRVARVLVVEGAEVAEGDVLVELVDNDAGLVERIEVERESAAGRVASARAAVLEMEGRVIDLQDARIRAIAASEQRVQVAVDRRVGADERVIEARAKEVQDLAQLARREKGLAAGVVSTRDLEVAAADAARATATLRQAEAAASAAAAEEAAAREDLERIRAEASANVGTAKASRDQAEMAEQSAVADLARAEMRQARQTTQVVRAPRAGRVHRVVASPNAELLKPGDPLVVLVPETRTPAVELWVDGRDLPFLVEGGPVRLQFEGWPALQFVGVPGVAGGTFGGVVALVDPAVDPGTGRVRVLVVPDASAAPWPDGVLLRQGSRAAGWVLLGQVPLGYEIWRQLNGFPPSPSKDGSKLEAGVSRGGKGK